MDDHGGHARAMVTRIQSKGRIALTQNVWYGPLREQLKYGLTVLVLPLLSTQSTTGHLARNQSND